VVFEVSKISPQHKSCAMSNLVQIGQETAEKRLGRIKKKEKKSNRRKMYFLKKGNTKIWRCSLNCCNTNKIAYLLTCLLTLLVSGQRKDR